MSFTHLLICWNHSETEAALLSSESGTEAADWGDNGSKQLCEKQLGEVNCPLYTSEVH